MNPPSNESLPLFFWPLPVSDGIVRFGEAFGDDLDLDLSPRSDGFVSAALTLPSRDSDTSDDGFVSPSTPFAFL